MTITNGVTLDFSRPSKPQDNALIEAFGSRSRRECLNEHRFLSVADAREKFEAWPNHYNAERPHGSLGNLAPEDFARESAALPAFRRISGRAPRLGDGDARTRHPQTSRGRMPRVRREA